MFRMTGSAKLMSSAREKNSFVILLVAFSPKGPEACNA